MRVRTLGSCSPDTQLGEFTVLGIIGVVPYHGRALLTLQLYVCTRAPATCLCTQVARTPHLGVSHGGKHHLGKRR